MNHDRTSWRSPEETEQHTPQDSPPPPPPPRRTNSLALEKSDCHTCSQKGRKCDRKRRRCGTCEQLNDTCTGYPVQLQWQDSNMQSTPVGQAAAAAPAPAQQAPAPVPVPVPVSVAPPAEPARAATSTAGAKPARTFKFVGNKPRKPRKSKKAKMMEERDRAAAERRPSEQIDMEHAVVPAQTQGETHPPHSTTQGMPEDGQGQYDAMMQDGQPQLGPQQIMELPDGAASYDAQYQMNWDMLDMSLSNNFNFMSLPNELLDIPNFVISPTDHGALLFDLETIQHPIQTPRAPDGQNGSSHRRTESEGQRSANSHQHDHSPLERVSGKNTSTPESLPAKLPPLSMTQDRCSTLLNMYDRVFCAYPLTGDSEANPFRCRDDTSSGSSYLLHAILAMSIHHLGRQIGDADMESESASHRDTAVQLYVDALKNPELHPDGLALLDTALILFAIDATRSAFGDWNDQIRRVVAVLEAFGGPEALKHSRRVRAQCAMFVWWDCTISLISRKSCIMNPAYFRLLSTYAGRDGWTWFDLVGCPLPLVGCLMELSALVAEYEKVRGMRWTKFDTSRVIAIQQFLRGWSDERFANIEEQDVDEEEMQLKRDGYMCTEAWRNAILIYIVRIFDKEDLPRSPHAMSFRSRVTLDCVRSCRKTTNVQKQLLMPVFLAACESSSVDAKAWAKEYCTFWNEKSAYGQFGSVVSLLETVWARQTIEGKDKTWWGQVIDDKCSSTVQCLLG